MKSEPFGTFSIVGFDAESGDLGVAVASRFFAVGAVVPWAKAGIGAIATQSWANTTYGPRGLEMLAEGFSPTEALARLTAKDEGRDQRQCGIVDAHGRAATYTGSECIDWAGGTTGEGFAAQGNILVGEEVIAAMASAFRSSAGELAEHLLTALEAGDRAGGDSRGRQSAALLVVREGGGVFGFNDRYIDIRCDDAPDPVGELRRMLRIRLRR